MIDLYEKREKSNRPFVTFIKTNISIGIRDFINQLNKVKDLLNTIDEQFVRSNKSLANNLIMHFSSMKLTWIRGVCDHIMCIKDIGAQLKDLEVTMPYSFLVHYILWTLPY